MKRFKITNHETNTDFEITDIKLENVFPVKYPKAWGKPAREVALDRATPFEKSREISRREVKEGEQTYIFISVPADYTIVEQDLTPELERQARKKETQRQRRGWLKALKKKKLAPEELPELMERLLMELFRDEEDYQ